MIDWKIPLFKMHYDENDESNVLSVLRRGMYWGLSSEITKLEQDFCDKTGMKYCVSFNSATSALHAIMIINGFKKGDEIITPSFTFIATSNSIQYVGATPIFADIEEETFGLDPFDVEARITNKTKAIIPVHYAGNICKINELQKIATKNNLVLIEDAATALGSKFKGKNGGSFGDFSIISMAWNKVITSGEGGVAFTNSKRDYEKLIRIRSHGRIDKENYFISSASPDYVSLGYNWRMSSINAALGLSQLAKLEKLIELRNNNANYLSELLTKIEHIETPKIPADRKSNFMLYPIRIKNGKKTRDKLRDFMNRKKIQTKVIYEPIHLTTFYKKRFGYKKGILKTTEKVSDQILCLPMYPNLKKEEIVLIADSIREFFER